MVFPGWVALLPCIGSAMVIHAGGNSWVARRILSARPIVFVGLISYSLYLWHWPVLVGLRMWTVMPQLPVLTAAMGVVVAFVLATLSWRYVERPFRNRREMGVSRVLGWTGAGAAVVILLAVPSVMTGGFPGRLSEDARNALAGASDIDAFRTICDAIPAPADCRFGNPDAPIAYAVIGDSHAAALRPAIEASGLMGDAAGVLLWNSSCALLDGIEMVGHARSAECADFRDRVWEEVEREPGLSTVVLGGRWPVYLTGMWPEDQSKQIFLTDSQSEAPSTAESKAAFSRALSRTLVRLTEMGRQVIIIGSVPETGLDIPHVTAQALYMGYTAPQGVPRSEIEVRAGTTDAIIAEAVQPFNSVRFIPLLDALCDDEWCDVSRDGVPLYSDDDHLSYRGALLIAPALNLGAVQLTASEIPARTSP